jgi:hypothetical protein
MKWFKEELQWQRRSDMGIPLFLQAGKGIADRPAAGDSEVSEDVRDI